MPQPETSPFTRIVLHVMFFLSGIATVLIGPVLPILARHFSLSDLEVSYFFPAQFAGSISGTLLSSWAARRNNYAAAAFAGTLLMAAGILLLNVDSYQICLLGFFVNGLGIGMTLPSINMLILEMSQGRAGSALSILNFCWGIGGDRVQTIRRHLRDARLSRADNLDPGRTARHLRNAHSAKGQIEHRRHRR